jgi:hypothetical protein
MVRQSDLRRNEPDRLIPEWALDRVADGIEFFGQYGHDGFITFGRRQNAHQAQRGGPVLEI